MSFILDALKKSENDRQQQASAEFAAIPATAAAPGAPRWIWLLIGLLVVNVAIVSIAMLRDDAEPPVAATPTPIPAQAETRPATPAENADAEPSFAERISTSAVSRPAPRAEPTDVSQRTSNATVQAPASREPAPAAGPQEPVTSTSSLAIPTLNELRLDEGVDLPDLHLDIHVYSRKPADRFVFINMQKHQEGSVLDSGPRVDEITPDGVVLEHRGTRFVLPRE